MRHAVLSGPVRRGRDRAGDGLLGDEPDRGERRARAGVQLLEQVLDLAAAANRRVNFARHRFADFNPVEMPQVDDYVGRDDRLAPGMARSDDANLLARVPVENHKDFFFGLRDIIPARSESEVAAEVDDLASFGSLWRHWGGHIRVSRSSIPRRVTMQAGGTAV
jgi:hypothetical protein